MTYDIANIILDQIKHLPFFDKYTGLVRRVVKKDEGENGRIVTTVFPVGCDVTETECQNMKLSDLVPNSKYKSIHYFEDLGSRFIGIDGGYFQFEATVRLVGWLNMKATGKQGQCSVSSLAITNILREMNFNRFNSGIYTKIQLIQVAQLVKDAAIFRNYTYDEQATQYLMHPFDYYAMDIKAVFSIHPSCIEEFELGPIPCP